MRGIELIERCVRPRSTQRAVLVTISPAIAEELLLRCNDRNRPLGKSHARMISDELTCGRWKVNGETIVVSATGRILTGQHRLQGCVNAKVPITTWVVVGVDDSAFDTMDQGQKKTVGDIFSISGETNASLLAAMATWFIAIESGGSRTWDRLSPQVSAEVVDRHQFARECTSLPRKSFVSAGHFAVMALAAEKYGIDRVRSFHGVVISGERLLQREPAWLLRERLISNATTKHNKVDQTVIVAMTIQATRAHMTNQKRSILRWRPGEEFPEL